MAWLSSTAGQSWLKKTAIAGGSAVGLVAIWLMGGNLLAAQREQITQKNWAEFAQQFPAKSSNPSAQELDRLASKLGLPSLVVHEGSFVTHSLPPAEERKFRKFSEYLNEQIIKSDNSIDAPAPELKQYYETQAETIAAIRQYLLTAASPQWEQKELKRYLSPNQIQITSYSHLAYLNDLLMFDALQNLNKGQSQAAYNSLKASWKLNQSLYQSPDLIAQLVAKITETYRIGVLRKMNGLPIGWQTELKSATANKEFLNALKLNSFQISEVYLKNFPRWNEGASGYTLAGKGSDSIAVNGSQFLLNPYFRFAALDYQENMQPVLSALPTKNFCALDAKAIAERLFEKSPRILVEVNFEAKQRNLVQSLCPQAV